MARADGAEAPVRGVRLAVAVVSPALDLARVQQRAGVLAAARDRDRPFAALRPRVVPTDAERGDDDQQQRNEREGRGRGSTGAHMRQRHGLLSLSGAATVGDFARQAMAAPRGVSIGRGVFAQVRAPLARMLFSSFLRARGLPSARTGRCSARGRFPLEGGNDERWGRE